MEKVKVYDTKIDGAYVVDPRVFGDERGSFTEFYRREWIPGSREVIQVNRSIKSAGAVVGFHYHMHQSDYWYVTQGEARAIIYDMRVDSPTYGELASYHLSGGNNLGLYIPPGVAHGFSSLTDMNLVYLVDNYHNPSDELGVAWDDPTISADWGVTDPIVSDRDMNNPQLKDISESLTPVYPLRT